MNEEPKAASLYEDPDWELLKKLNAQCFAIEQACRERGWEDARASFFRSRIDLGFVESRLRNKYKDPK